MGKLILPNLDPIKNPWVLYCKTDLETFEYWSGLLFATFSFLLVFSFFKYSSGNPRNRARLAFRQETLLPRTS